MFILIVNYNLQGDFMVEHDTIKLLRECDAGVKMGIKSISEVIDRVDSKDFKNLLTDNKLEHEKLESEIQHHLNRLNDKGKDPEPIATGMSWLKTKNLKASATLEMKVTEKVFALLLKSRKMQMHKLF